MNKSSIVAPDAQRNTLIRPTFPDHSSTTQNSRDQTENSDDFFEEKKSLPLPIAIARRVNGLKAELGERGMYAMIPLEISKMRWPGTRERIFRFIVGTHESRIIGWKDIAREAFVSYSRAKSQISYLCQHGFLTPFQVTARSRTGARVMTSWSVNPTTLWRHFSQASEENTSNLPGSIIDPGTSDAGEEESWSDPGFDDPCHFSQAWDEYTIKEEEGNKKNKKEADISEGRSDERPRLVKSDAPYLPIKPRTESETKAPRNKSGIGKMDLIASMRCLYIGTTSSLDIHGCIVYLGKRFDRSIIYDALEKRFERIQPDDNGLKWMPSHLKAWEMACREIAESREPTLAANG